MNDPTISLITQAPILHMWLIFSWPRCHQVFHILCLDRVAPSTPSRSVFTASTLTCFGQWDISKQDARTCVLRTPLERSLPVKKPRLQDGKDVGRLGTKKTWRMRYQLRCCHPSLALGVGASVVVVHRLSCHEACGIFPNQGSNPCCLHCQVNS